MLKVLDGEMSGSRMSTRHSGIVSGCTTNLVIADQECGGGAGR